MQLKYRLCFERLTLGNLTRYQEPARKLIAEVFLFAAMR